jgi:hypothetical protein
MNTTLYDVIIQRKDFKNALVIHDNFLDRDISDGISFEINDGRVAIALNRVIVKLLPNVKTITMKTPTVLLGNLRVPVEKIEQLIEGSLSLEEMLNPKRPRFVRHKTSLGGADYV